jgi:hypothetical protein
MQVTILDVYTQGGTFSMICPNIQGTTRASSLNGLAKDCTAHNCETCEDFMYYTGSIDRGQLQREADLFSFAHFKLVKSIVSLGHDHIFLYHVVDPSVHLGLCGLLLFCYFSLSIGR